MNAAVAHKKILLADDHPGALAQAASRLSEDYEILGTVSNGLELLDAAARFVPDVIVLDISMPGLNGFEAAQRLREAGCQCKLVFLTVWEDPDFAREAIAVGADAYVVKSRLASDLKLAVSEVLADHKFLSPPLTL